MKNITRSIVGAGKFGFICQQCLLGGAVILLSGCSAAGSFFNPFYEEPLLGDKNDKAISGGGQNEDTARQALEAMASYRRAQTPQPVDPVIQPAVVRLMWIPDHLNKNGDLVPAHYYYVKVLRDRWAVTDAFELEGQLGNGNRTSNIPFVHADEARPERMQ